MPLVYGSQGEGIAAAYIGSKKIAKMYLGSTLVFEAAPPLLPPAIQSVIQQDDEVSILWVAVTGATEYQIDIQGFINNAWSDVSGDVDVTGTFRRIIVTRNRRHRIRMRSKKGVIFSAWSDWVEAQIS